MVATGLIALWAEQAQAITISHSDALKVGKRVWQNECNGTISGLTSWNQGEDFASLGIGHFIWYPKERRGPFEEEFPEAGKLRIKSGREVTDISSGRRPWTALSLELACRVSKSAKYN